MNIGKLGVWMSQETLTAAQAVDQARRVEAWGYGALWQPEAVGRNVLVHAGWLLEDPMAPADERILELLAPAGR